MSGVQRYARELLTAFDRRLAVDAALAARIGPVRAVYPAGAAILQPPDWSVIRTQPLAGGTGHWWEQVSLARASRGARLLSLCGSGPLICRDQLLVIHDANVFDLPAAFSTPDRRFHRTVRPRLARRVAALATVSMTAAKALSPHLGVPVDGFAVIPNSADHILAVNPDPTTLSRFRLQTGRYLLSVGNQSPNKNIARLVAAHRAAGRDMPVLAVAGGFAPGVAMDAITASDRVRLLGRVSDGDLRSLYQGAAAFVWPARSEGFGIPPLEAMAMGVPVLSSDTTAMPEVLGDAALYFDPDDTADITRALTAFMALSPVVRGGMVAAGLTRAALFTWDASVDCLIAALDRI